MQVLPSCRWSLFEGILVRRNTLGLALLTLALGALAGCTSSSTHTSASQPKATFVIGGTISGLSGTGLVLQDNGGDNLMVSASGAFTFKTTLAANSQYAVTVSSQPTNPTQNCVVANGTGTVTANVTTAQVNCTTATFTIGGTVSGLSGTGLVLQDNGGDNLAVTTNGTFTFKTPLAASGIFAVTVFSQPMSLTQNCVVVGGTGTVTANVTTVQVKCTTATIIIGGTVSGLSGTGLVLQDNGGDSLTISANGSFSFPTPLATGESYTVTVLTQPTQPPENCLVNGGSGSVGTANVTSLAVTCTIDGLLTPVGTPVGSPVSVTIDASGGALATADGRLTVKVPAGAVTTATTFSIQPITNQAPGGIGLAYDLEPSGQPFAVPVTVALHYSADDIAGTVPEALTMAFQEAQGSQGYWRGYASPTLDKANSILSVQAMHFSGHAMWSTTKLTPALTASTVVPIGQYLDLSLDVCDFEDYGDSTTVTLLGCKSSVVTSAEAQVDVNGVPFGTPVTGTVEVYNPLTVRYTAPQTVPNPNIVSVGVSFGALLAPLTKHGPPPPISRFTLSITIGCERGVSAPVCSYKGVSTFDCGVNCVKATATDVTWTVQPATDPNSILTIYRPTSGTVTLTVSSQAQDCQLSPDSQTSVSISTQNVSPSSQLLVDFTKSPPHFDGGGLIMVSPLGLVCPNRGPFNLSGYVAWFAGFGNASTDGKTISGGTTQGTFTFTAQ